MKKTRKKLLSMALASAMVTTVLPTTAFAGEVTTPTPAPGTGNVTVNLGVKSPVIRVSVPTSLAVYVDEFEMIDEGNQIYSQDFSIINYSESAVNVEVNSTLTVNGVTLLDSKEEALSATGKKAWIAAAAAVAKDTYISGESAKISDLDEKAVNVTTFAESSNALTTKQNFYLEKAATPEYKIISQALNSGESIEAYTKFFKLKKIDISSIEAEAKLENINEAINAGDIYYKDSTDTEGKTLKKIEVRGVLDATNDAAIINAIGDEYYIIVEEVGSSAESLDFTDGGESYLYIEDATKSDKGSGGFRYIGVLGEQSDGAAWSAGGTNDDIASVAIKYTVSAMSGTDYGKIKNDTTNYKYGFYPEPQAASIIVPETGMKFTDTSYALTYDTGFGKLATSGEVSSIKLLVSDQDVSLTATTHYTIDSTNKKITLVPTQIGQLTTQVGTKATKLSAQTGLSSVIIVVTFADGKEATATINIG